MDTDYLKTWSVGLAKRGVLLEPGLSDAEVSGAEETYGFRFPPDLRALLQFALPADKHFPNWRSGPEADLRKRLLWPLEGLCFDVEHHVIWLRSWGLEPETLEDAVSQTRRLVADAPTLIPVYSHRYIPAEPQIDGNAVISVYQADIIYYGNDLANYFQNEFHVSQPSWAAGVPRPIRFWDEIIKWNNTPL